jgi:butyryl-CoA dehydrogenase
MARAALVASTKLQSGAEDISFYQAKIMTARFFAEHYLTQVPGVKISIVTGFVGTLALSESQF